MIFSLNSYDIGDPRTEHFQAIIKAIFQEIKKNFLSTGTDEQLCW